MGFRASWSDARNLVGEEWRPQLEEAIGRATVALVLVSDELLASRFVMGRELPALRARGIPLWSMADRMRKELVIDDALKTAVTRRRPAIKRIPRRRHLKFRTSEYTASAVEPMPLMGLMASARARLTRSSVSP